MKGERIANVSENGQQQERGDHRHLAMTGGCDGKKWMDLGIWAICKLQNDTSSCVSTGNIHVTSSKLKALKWPPTRHGKFVHLYLY
jgi:hypothetical protein